MASLDIGSGKIAPVLDKDGVRLTVDGSIATVTLTNPDKRNAQSPALWRALADAGKSLPGSVRVVVLRAEGLSFSAGLDRQAFTPEGFDGEPSFIDLARGSDDVLDDTIAEYQEAFTWWRRSDIITVAAVQGHAIGAGFQLALACDLRIAAEDVQLSMRETSLGLVPDLTGTHPSSPSWDTRAPWRSASPAATSTPTRPAASAWPTSWCPPTSSTPPRTTSPEHSSPRPATPSSRPRPCSKASPDARTRSSAPPSAPLRDAGSGTWRASATDATHTWPTHDPG